MSTRTDLSGLLRYDESGNLSRMLHEGLKKQKKTIEHLIVQARWRDAQASSETTIAELRVSAPTTAAVEQIVADLQSQVENALGPMPDGTMRIIAYEAGNSRDYLCSIQRRLTPKAGGMDHDLSLSLQLLRDSQALQAGLISQMQLAFAAQTVLVGQLAQANVQLASVRGSASAAADTAGGGIWGLLGFGALVLYMPTLKKKLGLPSNAPIDQVIERALKGLDMQMGDSLGLDAGDAKPRPPRGALSSAPHEHLMGDPADRPLDEKTVRAALPDHQAEIDLDELVAVARRRPQLIEALMAKVKEHPELMQLAINAAMGG